MSRCHGIQCHGNLHGVWYWPSKLSRFCQSLVCCHTSVCQSLVCCRLDPDFLLCFLHKTDLGPQVRLNCLQPEKAEVQSIRQGTLLPSLHLKTCVFFVSGFLLLLWNLHFMFSSCRCIGPTTFSWALRSEIQTMVIGQLFLRFDHWSVLPETWFYLETTPGLFVPGSSSRPWPTRVPGIQCQDGLRTAQVPFQQIPKPAQHHPRTWAAVPTSGRSHLWPVPFKWEWRQLQWQWRTSEAAIENMAEMGDTCW